MTFLLGECCLIKDAEGFVDAVDVSKVSKGSDLTLQVFAKGWYRYNPEEVKGVPKVHDF